MVVNSDSEEEEEVLSDGDEDGQEAWSGEINYVMGDVTHPQNTGASDVIIVHCVGECCVRGLIGKELLSGMGRCHLLKKRKPCLTGKIFY